MYLKDGHEMKVFFQPYMLKYDSTHGPFKGTIKVVEKSTSEINGRHIKGTSQRDPASIPWGDFGTDYVAGAKKPINVEASMSEMDAEKAKKNKKAKDTRRC
ncbi:hypothetical protein L1987_12559 [Smallanthus sonchifolius]|uniref:Uncharacterized protein n=1 Tax=Smallanthus sonchifolius TaxID=185202 RepID=A0ACB9JHK0_9ASTR|nr:hypothetical protein L1987_12559 [Smallanthus sonchifolius]